MIKKYELIEQLQSESKNPSLDSRGKGIIMSMINEVLEPMSTITDEERYGFLRGCNFSLWVSDYITMTQYEKIWDCIRAYYTEVTYEVDNTDYSEL